jgi:diguanylate cyclase (GGDEF)-like protein/PAS domain S-box-containing protein
MTIRKIEDQESFLLGLFKATVSHIGNDYFSSLVGSLVRQSGAARAYISVVQRGVEGSTPVVVASAGDAAAQEIPAQYFVQDFFDLEGRVLGSLTMVFRDEDFPYETLQYVLGFLKTRIVGEFARNDLELRLTKAHRREVMHSRVLGMTATHQPLPGVLEAVVLGVEAEHPELLCSILLVNPDRKRLLTGAAPSLPAEYNKAIHGTPIRMGVGSCGTAAFTGERLIASNLQEHAYWGAVRELTAKHNLCSCWSQPIKASNGVVLGTFAIYQHQPDEPSPDEIELIESTAQLLGLVLDHYQTLEELGVRTRKYQMFLQMASDGIVVMDSDGRVLEASEGFLRMVEAGREETLGSSIWQWDALNDEAACKKRLAMTSEVPVIYHTINRTLNGKLWNAEVSSAAFMVENKRLIWASARDVTERKRLEAELKRRATTDDLTGVSNRGSFMDSLKAEYSRASRHKRILSVIMLDLDYFKSINDRFGHATGDKVLRAVSRLCGQALREEDFIGRLGGEEFAVMLPETDAINALEVAERIRHLIASAVIETDCEDGDATLSPSCSLGVAILRDDDSSHEHLLARADKALYEAKQTGRNRVCFAKA